MNACLKVHKIHAALICFFSPHIFIGSFLLDKVDLKRKRKIQLWFRSCICTVTDFSGITYSTTNSLWLTRDKWLCMIAAYLGPCKTFKNSKNSKTDYMFFILLKRSSPIQFHIICLWYLQSFSIDSIKN